MIQPHLKIGVSGVRGVAGVSLTPQIVASFAAAFGTYCGKGKIVIGSDTRPSREMVAPAVEAGLQSVGCIPVRLGVVPVPTLQFHVRQIGAAGGICITASHNPMEWNALKFCTAEGTAIPANRFAELLDLYHQGIYPRVAADLVPDPIADDSALDLHFEAVSRLIDIDLVKSARLKVAVDCCNGAGSLATPEFLRRLGCRVEEIHTRPGEPFPRDPEPLRKNLGDLRIFVTRVGADIGFAQDADADRLSIVDETGEPLGEDCTIVLAVRRFLQREPGPVVVNVSTSRMIDDVAAGFGVPVYRSRVGEIHVLEEMQKRASKVGGEGNGGVIVLDTNRCRDSFVAMALILESLALEARPVGAIRKEVPAYFLLKEKIPCRPRQAAGFVRLLKQVFRGEEQDLTDGIKVNWPDRWLHVRASNTEPVIRVLAEAPDEATCRSLVGTVMEYLRPLDAEP